MKKVNIDHINLYGTEIDRITTFVDDDNNVIVLPLLWAIHLKTTGLTYKWVETGTRKSRIYSKSNSDITNTKVEFIKEYLSDQTIKNYINHVFIFIKYLNETKELKLSPGPNNTEITSRIFLRHYVNKILPERLESVSSLISHKSALESYFNFLYYIDIRESSGISIERVTKQKIAEGRIKQRSIKYISRKDRLLLIQECTNKRDRIIIRLGYEVGLRAKEIRGIIINDFKANKSNNKGMISLFNEFESNRNKEIFSFTLSGKYTKGGTSRTIYFNRDLLESMKDYYETERIEKIQGSGKSCETLLVRNDHNGIGLSVSECQATNTFRKLRENISQIDRTARFHDLRHTFATELFHSELRNRHEYNDKNNSALIEVSNRLGHKNIESSRIYIRMRASMLSIEGFLE